MMIDWLGPALSLSTEKGIAFQVRRLTRTGPHKVYDDPQFYLGKRSKGTRTVIPVEGRLLPRQAFLQTPKYQYSEGKSMCHIPIVCQLLMPRHGEKYSQYYQKLFGKQPNSRTWRLKARPRATFKIFLPSSSVRTNFKYESVLRRC